MHNIIPERIPGKAHIHGAGFWALVPGHGFRGPKVSQVRPMSSGASREIHQALAPRARAGGSLCPGNNRPCVLN